MRSLLATTAVALAVALPGSAIAQELKFSGGFTLASKYVADGVPQTTGAAIQPWIEGEINGFYFGAWLSNVSKSLMGTNDTRETDLYLGYRNEVGRLNYDIGYTRYLYNKTGNCCGDAHVALGFAVTDQFSLGTKVKYNSSAKVTNALVSAGYAFNDKFSVEAIYGKINKGGHKYWSIGGSYALNDDFGLSLTWTDTKGYAGGDKSHVVLALDYAFSFN